MKSNRQNGAGTDPKAYLSQVQYLDTCINSKQEQLKELNALEIACNSGMGGELKNSTELKEEIQNDMNELVNLKKRIKGVINTVPDPVYRALLEKRYLSCLPWNRIAMELGFELRYIHKLHNKALAECVIPEEDTSGHYVRYYGRAIMTT